MYCSTMKMLVVLKPNWRKNSPNENENETDAMEMNTRGNSQNKSMQRTK